MSREEKLLKELLESYWEEKWKKMPDREEIAGEHDFSEDFQNKIRKIGRKRKKKKYLTAAAAAAVLLLFAAVQGNPEVWAIEEEKSEDLQMDAAGESISEESGEDSGIREESGVETEEYGGTDKTEERWQLSGEEGGKIRTILKNQGSGEMGVSCVLAVEYLEEGEWRQIWKTEEETEEVLDPGEIREEEFDLDTFGADDPGTYRFVRRIDGRLCFLFVTVS